MLEFDSISDRYSYHRLIKSFFFSLVNSTEDKDFSLAFQTFFAEEIQFLVDEYVSSPKKGLIKLNLEQHNLLHFVKSLQGVSYLDHPHNHNIELINTYYMIFQSGYLYLRLSSKNLIESTNGILHNIEKIMQGHQKNSITFSSLFKVYVNLIAGICSLKVQNDMDLALKECTKRIPFIESVKKRQDATEQYVHFYRHILSFSIVLDDESLKLYHARILKKVSASNLDCDLDKSFTTCEYFHLASSYESLRDYEKSAIFFEKAVKKRGLSYPLDTLHYLIRLFALYVKLGNSNKRKEIESKLFDLYDTIIDQTSSNVHSHMERYRSYLTMLRAAGETKKAIAIYEKIVDSMNELGNCEFYRVNSKSTLGVVDDLLKLNEFKRAEEFSNKLLLCISENSSVHQFIGFVLRRNKALYFSGNFLEAKKKFRSMMTFLVTRNLTESYSQDYADVCYYLIMSGSFDYLWRCYFYKMIAALKIGMHWGFYIIFGTPFDIFLKNNSSASSMQDLPIETNPQITKLSEESSLSCDLSSRSVMRILTAPCFHVLNLLIPTTYLKLVFISLTNSILFRFFAYLLSVYFRLLIVFHFCIILFRRRKFLCGCNFFVWIVMTVILTCLFYYLLVILL